MEERNLFQPEWVQKYRTTMTKLSDCMEKQEFSCQAEKGRLYMCRLWQGITIWKNEVYMHNLPTETLTDYPFLKLNYCTVGRCETLLENGNYVYMEEGDLSIDCNAPKEKFQYPSGKYEGLEIVFNMEILKQQPIVSLTDFGIGLEWYECLKDKYQGSIITKVSSEVDVLAKTIMEKLKSADGKLEDYRFLTLHLLYMLNGGHTFTWKKNIYVTKGQRMIAEKAKDRLCQNLRQHQTVEELAQEFGISPSSLKKYFRLVYGSPVSEYIRNVKMELACRLLRETQMSVGEVAVEAGYASQGKFGSVFKKYTGKAPLEYRRNAIGGVENAKADRFKGWTEGTNCSSRW